MIERISVEIERQRRDVIFFLESDWGCLYVRILHNETSRKELNRSFIGCYFSKKVHARN